MCICYASAPAFYFHLLPCPHRAKLRLQQEQNRDPVAAVLGRQLQGRHAGHDVDVHHVTGNARQCCMAWPLSWDRDRKMSSTKNDKTKYEGFILYHVLSFLMVTNQTP